MKGTKGKVAIILIFSLLISLFPVTLARDKIANVEFVASSLDKNDNFSITMSITNANFNAFQFVLRYDSDSIMPINPQSGLKADRFSDFTERNLALSDVLSELALDLDKDAALIEFTNYLTPGKSYSSDGSTVENIVSIGNEPIGIYKFHFKKISSKTPLLELAKQDGVKPYRNYLPDGGGIAYGAKLPLKITFDLTELEGKISEEEYIPPTPPDDSDVPPEEPVEEEPKRPTTSKERLEDTLVLQIGNYAAAQNGALCHIYPGEKDVVPYIKDDRTFLPFRFVAESLGFKVVWDAKTKSVTFYDEEQKLVLVVGEKDYTKNGELYSMDVAPEIMNDRTMVPIRFVAEALGFAVEWDPISKMVFITKEELPWLLDDAIEVEATSEIALIISPLIRDFV